METVAEAAASEEKEEEEEEEEDGSPPPVPLLNHELKNPPPPAAGPGASPSPLAERGPITSSKDSAEVPAAAFQLTTMRITRPEDIRQSPTEEDAPVSARHTSPDEHDMVNDVG